MPSSRRSSWPGDRTQVSCTAGEIFTIWVTMGASGKEPAASLGDPRDIGLIPVSGEGNGNTLQYSCLENPMNRGAWWATVQGVSKSRTWPSDLAQMLRLSWQWPLCSNSFSVSLQVINSLKTEAVFFFFFLLPIMSEPSRDLGTQ